MARWLITVSHKATIENIVGLEADTEQEALDTLLSMANVEGVEDFKVLHVEEINPLEFATPLGPIQ